MSSPYQRCEHYGLFRRVFFFKLQTPSCGRHVKFKLMKGRRTFENKRHAYGLTWLCLQLYWSTDSSSGHPVLVIEIGNASREYSKHDLLLFAEAIVTQVEKAVRHRFSDAPGYPEQMMVVTSCQGASALKVSLGPPSPPPHTHTKSPPTCNIPLLGSMPLSCPYH